MAIIDDILDLATIDAGTLELKLSPVKVREVIEQAVQGVEERLKQNDVALDIDIEPGIDEFVADGRRVTQMLYNLLSNAIGFSEAGGKIALGCGRQEFHDRLHRRGSGRRHPRRTISRPCSTGSRAARTARAIAARGSDFPSSRASPSCMAAPCTLELGAGTGNAGHGAPAAQAEPAGEAAELDEPRYQSSRAG